MNTPCESCSFDENRCTRNEASTINIGKNMERLENKINEVDARLRRFDKTTTDKLARIETVLQGLTKASEISSDTFRQVVIQVGSTILTAAIMGGIAYYIFINLPK